MKRNISERMINSSESQGKATSWATTSSNIRDTLASYERQLAESRELDERAERIRKEAAESRKSTQEVIYFSSMHCLTAILLMLDN